MCYRRVRCWDGGSSHTLIEGGRVKEMALEVTVAGVLSFQRSRSGDTVRGSASGGCVAAAFCSVCVKDRSPRSIYVVLAKHLPCPSE